MRGEIRTGKDPAGGGEGEAGGAAEGGRGVRMEAGQQPGAPSREKSSRWNV